MKKITAVEWMERYEITSAANTIALVYTLEKRVYMSIVEDMTRLPVKIEQRTSISGEEYESLRLDVKQINLLHLRDKGAALLGFAKDFFAEWENTRKDTHENKGEYIERKIIEKYHGTPARVGAAYYESGDAIIAGMDVQIKGTDATLARIDTIREQWKKKGRTCPLTRSM